MTLTDAQQKVGAYGYRISNRACYMSRENLFPDSGLPLELQLASTVAAKARAERYTGDWIIHDPLSDEDGWMLVFDMHQLDEMVAQTLDQAN